MNTTLGDPTKKTYATLQAAVGHFNRRLFDNALPPCLITFQRRANALGYFAHDRFEHRDERSTTDEIALNPKHFNERPPEDTLSTLVHEMVHLRQHLVRQSRRGRYHNKQWADWMSEIGLEPSSTGRPGGKRTGEQTYFERLPPLFGSTGRSPHSSPSCFTRNWRQARAKRPSGTIQCETQMPNAVLPRGRGRASA
jgi:predicted SprT family Zn-dependent metalloprotease